MTSEADHSNLYINAEATDENRAHVIIIHGYAEHSGRYDRIANLLKEHNYGTTRFDLRGYGRSPGKPALVSTLDDYIDDLITVSQQLRDSTIPLIIFGHSMGALIALRSVLADQVNPTALVLSSPALAFFEPGILQNISGFLGSVFPALPTISLNRSLVSRDPSVVEAAINDPLCFQGHIRAGTGAAIVRAARQVNGALNSLQLPFIVFHGEKDKLIDPEGSKRLFAEASSDDKTIKLYPDSVHETLNDYGHEIVESDIVDWLSKRF